MLMDIFNYLNLCVIENVLEKIYKKYVLCQKEENNIKHVINECVIMKELEKLKNVLRIIYIKFREYNKKNE